MTPADAHQKAPAGRQPPRRSRGWHRRGREPPYRKESRLSPSGATPSKSQPLHRNLLHPRRSLYAIAFPLFRCAARGADICRPQGAFTCFVPHTRGSAALRTLAMPPHVFAGSALGTPAVTPSGLYHTPEPWCVYMGPGYVTSALHT